MRWMKWHFDGLRAWLITKLAGKSISACINLEVHGSVEFKMDNRAIVSGCVFMGGAQS